MKFLCLILFKTFLIINFTVMIRYLIFISGFFISICADAQQIIFEKTFGSIYSEFSRSVKQTSNGFIYIAGFSDSLNPGVSDITFSKLTSDGQLIWTKYFGDTLDDYGLYLNLTTGGNFVLTGETYTSNNGIDAIILLLDSNGVEKKRTILNSPVNESLKFVEQTKDGGFILCGFKNDSLGSNDSYVVKLDSSGNVEWDKMFGGDDNDYADMIRQTGDGGYILTADTKSKGMGGYDIELIKLDSLGNIEWDYTYGDEFENGCQGILVTSDGNYLSFGETRPYPSAPFNFYLELVDPNGNSIWKETPGRSEADAAFSAVETDDKGFMFTGYSNSYSPGPLNIVVFKIDSIGTMEWIKTFGDDGIDIGYEVIHSVLGGFLITGKTFVNGTENYYLLHIDDSGIIDYIPNKDSKQLKVYPNPSIGEFSIQSNDNAAYIIRSIEGKIICNGNLTAGSNLIKMPDSYSQGVYFINILNNEINKTEKIIIK